MDARWTLPNPIGRLKECMKNELSGHQSAVWEARALYLLLSTGHTADELRAPIGVPPRNKRVLLAYARAHPKEARLVEAALMFRAEVASAFERLVREGAQIADVPEAEKESDVTEAAYADAQA